MYIFKIKWALSLSFNQLNSNQLKLKGKWVWGVALLVKSLPSMHKALDSVPVLYKLVILMHQGICTDVHTRGVGEPCNSWRIAFGSVLTHYWALCICSKMWDSGMWLPQRCPSAPYTQWGRLFVVSSVDVMCHPGATCELDIHHGMSFTWASDCKQCVVIDSWKQVKKHRI